MSEKKTVCSSRACINRKCEYNKSKYKLTMFLDRNKYNVLVFKDCTEFKSRYIKEK